MDNPASGQVETVVTDWLLEWFPYVQLGTWTVVSTHAIAS